MSTITYLDRFLTPVSEAFTPELATAVLQIQVDAETQAHVNSLATRANSGQLTADEEAEYIALINAADLISVLQLKARRYLANAYQHG